MVHINGNECYRTRYGTICRSYDTYTQGIHCGTIRERKFIHMCARGGNTHTKYIHRRFSAVVYISGICTHGHYFGVHERH